jgi:hypothetical protein
VLLLLLWYWLLGSSVLSAPSAERKIVNRAGVVDDDGFAFFPICDGKKFPVGLLVL